MTQQTEQIAIITDSTFDLPSEVIEAHHITVVPLYIMFGTQELRDGVDIQSPEFYRRLAENSVTPTTSMPTPHDYVRAIQQLRAKEAIIFTLSSGLSTTIASAQAASEMVDIPVHVVDTRLISMAAGWQVIAATQERERGGSVESILQAAKYVREQIIFRFTTDGLDYLHRGGRIGGASRLLGSALKVNPLMTIGTKTGCIDAVELVRTRKRALKKMVEVVFDRLDTSRPICGSVMYGADYQTAKMLYDNVIARYKPERFTIGQITPTIGAHTGPGVIGFGGFNLPD